MKDILLSNETIFELKAKLKENDLYIDTLAIQERELLDDVVRLVSLRDKAKERGNYALAKRHEKHRCMLLDRQAKLLDIRVKLHIENSDMVKRILSSRRASGKKSILHGIVYMFKPKNNLIDIYLLESSGGLLVKIPPEFENAEIRVEHASHTRYSVAKPDEKGHAIVELPDVNDCRYCPFVLIHVTWTHRGKQQTNVLHLVPQDTKVAPHSKIWSPIKDGAKHYKRYMGL